MGITFPKPPCYHRQSHLTQFYALLSSHNYSYIKNYDYYVGTTIYKKKKKLKVNLNIFEFTSEMKFSLTLSLMEYQCSPSRSDRGGVYGI